MCVCVCVCVRVGACVCVLCQGAMLLDVGVTTLAVEKCFLGTRAHAHTRTGIHAHRHTHALWRTSANTGKHTRVRTRTFTNVVTHPPTRTCTSAYVRARRHAAARHGRVYAARRGRAGGRRARLHRVPGAPARARNAHAPLRTHDGHVTRDCANRTTQHARSEACVQTGAAGVPRCHCDPQAAHAVHTGWAHALTAIYSHIHTRQLVRSRAHTRTHTHTHSHRHSLAHTHTRTDT